MRSGQTIKASANFSFLFVYFFIYVTKQHFVCDFLFSTVSNSNSNHQLKLNLVSKPFTHFKSVVIDIKRNCSNFTAEKMSKLVSCDFEVFGKVQGVYFRKYTEKQAIILGLRGEVTSDK